MKEPADEESDDEFPKDRPLTIDEENAKLERDLMRQQKKAEASTKRMARLPQVLAIVKTLTAMKAVKNDPMPGQLYDNLYIGGVGAAYNHETIEKLKITHILTVANKIKPRFEEKGIIYKIIPVRDAEDESILPFFEEAVQFIQEVHAASEDNKVLVHCFAGKSRATSFTLAYLMRVKRLSLKEGLEKIWEVRKIAHPNKGFVNQLKEFEMAEFGKVSDFTVLEGKLEELKKQAEIYAKNKNSK